MENVENKQKSNRFLNIFINFQTQTCANNEFYALMRALLSLVRKIPQQVRIEKVTIEKGAIVKSYNRKSFNRKSYNRKSYNRNSYNIKSHNRKSYNRKSSLLTERSKR